MARIHAKSVLHLVDEHDFSGVSNQAQIDISGNHGDVTAYADVDQTFLEGKPGWSANIQGLFSTASPNYDGEMFIDLTTTDRRVGLYPGGATDGNFGYEGASKISESPRVANPGSAIALNVNWRGDGPLARSVILDVDTAVGATGNGTAFQLPAVAADETIVGIIRLLAAPGGAGSNTLNAIIESDSVEAFSGTPATQLTFTQLSEASVATFEVNELAGANADVWWRVGYTYAGAGSRTFSVIVTLGIRKT